MSAEDMVVFLMPDGTKVSNDPRFGLEEAMKKSLDSRQNTGDAGIPQDEQDAQTQRLSMANLNSGQPGVGENAVPEDPKEFLGPQGTPAMQRQVDDRKEAEEKGLDATTNPVPDENRDSNEAVLEVRQARQKAREKALKAVEDLGDEGAGDTDLPYSEWSGKQLKAEALGRNAERNEEDQIPLKGVRKTSELARLLEEDDARVAARNAATGNPGEGENEGENEDDDDSDDDSDDE